MYNRTDSGWLESTYLAAATSTSILKLIFPTAYCFFFDSDLNGCVAIFVVVFSVVISTVILIFVVVVVIATFTFIVGISVGFFSLLLLLIFIYGLFV